MFITQHARGRIMERVPAGWAGGILARLEHAPGEPGVYAYIVANLPYIRVAEDGSNGDILVVVAVDASVETVYLRRAEQDMSAAFFGAERVVDLRAGRDVSPEDDTTRQERRATRVRNERKMRVTGASTRLLAELSKRPRARKRRQKDGTI